MAFTWSGCMGPTMSAATVLSRETDELVELRAIVKDLARWLRAEERSGASHVPITRVRSVLRAGGA